MEATFGEFASEGRPLVATPALHWPSANSVSEILMLLLWLVIGGTIAAFYEF